MLCLALVVVRVGGAHLHLCFDGSEPPVSFHAVDLDPHHGSPDASTMHEDADLAIGGDILAKQAKLAGSLVALLVLSFLFAVLAGRHHPLVCPRTAPARLRTPRLLRPYLRGPPLSPSL